MIGFTCGGCGRAFTVPDSYAGRKAKCKNCGAPVAVPEPAGLALVGSGQEDRAPSTHNRSEAEASAPPPVRKIPMRQRRLIADAEQMAAAFKAFPLIQVLSKKGEPPEMYQIEYHVKGLERGRKNQPVPRGQHQVEIQLTSEYPRVSPKCKMLTPIFHPNIDPATICVGDHWAAGERLVDLVIRIGEMIGYQAYNIKSPLDGEAAMWADLNQSKLPIDNRVMRPPDLE